MNHGSSKKTRKKPRNSWSVSRPEKQVSDNSTPLSEEEIEAQLSKLKSNISTQDESSNTLASDIGYIRKHGGLPANKKSLGQNWLISQESVDNIVSLVKPRENKTIVEIGPGSGALTDVLLKSRVNLTSVEIDSRMIEVLQSRHESNKNLRLVHADILRTNLNDLMGGAEFSLIGNLPYNITSSLFFKLLDHAREYPGQIKRSVLMVQLEVAKRIIAKPGDSDYSILSVFSRVWGEPKLGMIVSREEFEPVPKVDAGVIVMDFAPESLYPLPSWITFKRLVKGTFSKRRKMLRNSLSGIQHIANWQNLDFDFSRRPQTLSAEEFAWLAARLIPGKLRE